MNLNPKWQNLNSTKTWQSYTGYVKLFHLLSGTFYKRSYLLIPVQRDVISCDIVLKAAPSHASGGSYLFQLVPWSLLQNIQVWTSSIYDGHCSCSPVGDLGNKWTFISRSCQAVRNLIYLNSLVPHTHINWTLLRLNNKNKLKPELQLLKWKVFVIL
jgi:hypothetical protein